MIVSMIALSGKKSRLRAVFHGKGLNDMKRKLCYFLLMTALLLPVCAFGEYDAGQMQTWLVRFCEALPALSQQGDPGLTADPARPGEYLLQYAFGTVVAKAPVNPQPEDIIEIQVRTQQVTDCRGMRVGMALQEVTGGAKIGRSSTQLYVLSAQEAGLGFAWAYLGDSGVHGVEYITYGSEDAGVTEYTLTYVLDEQQQVSAIRIRCAPATQAQAQQAMDTVEEIAQRQWGEVYAVRNTESVLTAQDMQVTGIRALGLAAWELVGKLGEPVEVQTLPAGQGRILLYEGAAISLKLDEMTGEEVVVGVNVSGFDVAGPRGVSVGMSVQEAASLFRCDEDVYAVGGTLYLEGEAAGEAPFGELVCGELTGEALLRYAAVGPTGRTEMLEIGVKESTVVYWRFFVSEEDTNDGY